MFEKELETTKMREEIYLMLRRYPEAVDTVLKEKGLTPLNKEEKRWLVQEEQLSSPLLQKYADVAGADLAFGPYIKPKKEKYDEILLCELGLTDVFYDTIKKLTDLSYHNALAGTGLGYYELVNMRATLLILAKEGEKNIYEEARNNFVLFLEKILPQLDLEVPAKYKTLVKTETREKYNNIYRQRDESMADGYVDFCQGIENTVDTLYSHGKSEEVLEDNALINIQPGIRQKLAETVGKQSRQVTRQFRSKQFQEKKEMYLSLITEYPDDPRHLFDQLVGLPPFYKKSMD